jgi:hypothetical protein
MFSRLVDTPRESTSIEASSVVPGAASELFQIHLDEAHLSIRSLDEYDHTETH